MWRLLWITGAIAVRSIVSTAPPGGNAVGSKMILSVPLKSPLAQPSAVPVLAETIASRRVQPVPSPRFEVTVISAPLALATGSSAPSAATAAHASAIRVPALLQDTMHPARLRSAIQASSRLPLPINREQPIPAGWFRQEI